jgi:septal ring factor EnvC (AmiA/AmiB activator)
VAQGVTEPRTALQTLADELDHTRRLLKAASARETVLERRIRSLEQQVRNGREKAEAWKTVAAREERLRRRKVPA